MPDRALVTMTAHCMHSYSLLAIKTCHRRGIHAIGGMAAQIPIKNDPQANAEAMEKVRADKEREAGDGHDGTWVAHPGLVPIAKASFDARMPQPNQIARRRDDVQVTADDLLQVPQGEISERGLCQNIDVGIQYMASWLAGNGCVPIYNLMEDAATAEISRAQIWQWVHQPNGVLSDGRKITPDLVRRLFQEQMDKLQEKLGAEAFAQRQFRPAQKVDRGDRVEQRVHGIHDPWWDTNFWTEYAVNAIRSGATTDVCGHAWRAVRKGAVRCENAKSLGWKSHGKWMSVGRT